MLAVYCQCVILLLVIVNLLPTHIWRDAGFIVQYKGLSGTGVRPSPASRTMRVARSKNLFALRWVRPAERWPGDGYARVHACADRDMGAERDHCDPARARHDPVRLRDRPRAIALAAAPATNMQTSMLTRTPDAATV